ncbi:MAG: SIS domain-containing protein [Firmicutes bacterium]|nr:SIS domain-containing protein [Bacillota bacterium]
MTNSTIENYFSRIASALNSTNTNTIKEIAKLILQTKGKNAIFIAGNGGSAATASHFCNDLIKGCRVHGRTGFAAQCLSDSTPVLTCLANDFSYEDAYKIALETYAKAGDLLIVFSGSGNSPNILSAAKRAKEMGLTIIGFGGRDGGKMKELCDICLIAPTYSMEELEDLHLCYCHALVTYLRGELKDIWDMEIINYPPPTGFRYALFDFDGTVSLLREGWREIMIPYFTEVISAVAPYEKDIEELVAEFVDLLTGKQTIFQCIRLDEEVQRRGGPAKDPHEYKAEYLRRLMEQIHTRHKGLKACTCSPEEHLVPGIVEFLQMLKNGGVKIYLASGTDEVDVKAEAELLGVAHFFDGDIYGAKDTIKDCSKELVIQQILEENNIRGADLISFGDGYIEVQLVKDIGGYAVAVATDEARKKGVNEWKRTRLLSANADMVIPDFENAQKLYDFIVTESEKNNAI